MKSNQLVKSVFVIIVMTFLVVLVTRMPAMAVVSGDLVIVDNGTPVPGATVSLVDEDGNVVAEGETDDNGKVGLYIPLGNEGKEVTIIVRKKDGSENKTPWTIPKEGWGKKTIDISKTIPKKKLSVGIWIEYMPSTLDNGTNIQTNFVRLQTFTSDSHYQNDSLGGGLAIQYNFSRPPLSLIDAIEFSMGFLPQWGSGSSPTWDFHPPIGVPESYARIRRSWKFQMGLNLLKHIPIFQQIYASVGIGAGVAITRFHYSFITDERGGGGQFEHSTRTRTIPIPEIRAFVDLPFRILGQLFSIRGGVNFEAIPGFTLNTASRTFGFPYRVEWERSTNVTGFIRLTYWFMDP